MALDILCTPSFSASDESKIDEIAKELNVSREEAIRSAVRFYSSACVPTHSKLSMKK